MSGSLVKYLEKPWGQDGDGIQEVFPFYLTVFLFVCFLFLFLFIHSGQVEWCCLGLHQIVRCCPLGVLCWLLPLPVFAARGQEVAQVQAREAEIPAHWCPSAHGAPWAEHQDLGLFFCFTFFFFQITVGRNFIKIPRVGLRGWSGSCGGKWARVCSWWKRQFSTILVKHRFEMVLSEGVVSRLMVRASRSALKRDTLFNVASDLESEKRNCTL